MKQSIVVKGIDCLQAAFVDYCKKLGCYIDSSIKEDFKNLEPIPYLQVNYMAPGLVTVEKVTVAHYDVYKLPEDWKIVTEVIKEALKAPEFKIGDWVVVDNLQEMPDGTIGTIGRITHHSDIIPEMLFLEPECRGRCFLPKNLRYASEKEIKEFLIKEAEKRGFVEGFDLSRVEGNYYRGSIKSHEWYYNVESDYLENFGAMIYRDGVWSKINSEKINLPFGNEIVEVLNSGEIVTSLGIISSFEVDCFYEQLFQDISVSNGLVYESQGLPETIQLKIKEVKIGCTTGTVEQLREIIATSFKVRGL